MEYNTEGNTLKILLPGRIDSSNSAQVDKELNTVVASQPHEDVVLDAEKLEYISSAGLRVLMKLKKSAGGAVSIVNASNEVYEIFEVTGFTQLFDVTKQLRHVSVDGCELIGVGGNGSVYRLDPDTIIKVYKHTATLEKITTERNYAQAAFLHGIPTAISYDTVLVGDSYGIVFELLNAKTVGATLSLEPDRAKELGISMGRLLKTLHTTEMDEGTLPRMSDKIRGWINWMEEMKYLGSEDISLLHSVLEQIPERNTIIHSDFHEGNVMIQNGELILIDLDDICVGHPVYDLAFNYMSHVIGQARPDIIKKSLNIDDPQLALEIRAHMMREYFGGVDDERIRQIDQVIGAMAMFMSSFIPAKSKDSANMTPETIQGILDIFVPKFRAAAHALPAMVGSLGL